MEAMTDTLPAAVHAELDAGLDALGLPRDHAPPLLAYLALLLRWNRAYNLTAIRDPREMVGKHLLDSLAMHASVDAIAAAGGSLADLGTGAGLPGIPLAIVKPALQVTLVEANGKKARFLREAVRTLPLPNARVVESRIEAFAAPAAFDAITARALATLSQILELGGHLLKPAGVLLAMKGALPSAEIAALPAGWQLQDVRPLTVPGLAAERHLVVVGRKQNPAQADFPGAATLQPAASASLPGAA
jgi:16S rRNA (guanine527-N7)-methyltransferase